MMLGAAASGQYQDAQLWTGISVRYSPWKKWKVNLDEEARFSENLNRLNKINSELTVSYQINKIIDGGLLYKLIASHQPGGNFSLNHRFGAFLVAQKKFLGWSGTIRTSFQKTYPEFLHSSDWYDADNYVRILAELSRELKNKKTEPYTNIEFWYRLTSGEKAFIDQYRFTAGIKHKLNKRNRLDFFFRIQQELQVKDPLTAYVLGVGYGFTVRR
jgi:hypothetical protein